MWMDRQHLPSANWCSHICNLLYNHQSMYFVLKFQQFMIFLNVTVC